MQSQTLSLAQRQQLQMVLAPQLRQSLEMLQLPILELRAMIQQEIEKNPTLEESPAETEADETPQATSENTNEIKELDFDKEFQALAKLDDEWRDYFFQDRENRPYTSDDAEKRQFFMDSLPQKESLQEHLINQLNLAGLPENDRQIGELIIGSINDDGYVTGSLEELAVSAGTDIHHLEDILSLIQDFHPTGIAARDLKECLLIQLERTGIKKPLAETIVREHLDKLGGKKFTDLAKALKVSVEEVQQAAKLISTLDPKPGRIYSGDVATYILAEIVVQKINGEYVIVLNDDQLPHLRISKNYIDILKDKATTPEVKSYIRERIRSSAFMIKSIHQRQKTIYRIAAEIVKTQTGFLDHGISSLKPLTMAEVALVVGVHETTVSRAVSGKYMQTPNGIFEMKYFFTPGITTADGREISNKTVKDIIAGLVANEDPDKPLSDQEIMEKLKEQGINIARRTIAKYRLVLRIPPSHLRKSY
ncbi:MAG: RNA polymerase factor sigma-54 [Kiritimatiellae bacterium]|nr:RNA polymerase factor sigma-54 [Kiritimatiellia bacterium]MDD5521445.1 RNA polymerase factor sigma-54 [Kiritimatiellia bacterium]